MSALDGMALTRALFIAAAVLAIMGAVAALGSANALKRVAGIIVAQIGALIALASLGAPTLLLGAGALVCFAQVALGAALIVRLQEGYGETEMRGVDVADAASEPAEPPP